MPNEPLWSADPLVRLAAARALGRADRHQLLERISQGTPTAPWPYGMPTSVNPWVVVIGASPGVSPDPTERRQSSPVPYALPTIGVGHPGFAYRDARGFWDKTRLLTRTALRSACDTALNDADADALSGLMNLDDGQSGSAAAAAFRPDFADWAVRVVVERLRPRLIVAVGLSSGRANRVFREAIARATGRELSPRPDVEKIFAGYPSKRLKFRTWQLALPSGALCDLVFWPQHPSRAPFTSSGLWAEACSEYCAETWQPDSGSRKRPK